VKLTLEIEAEASDGFAEGEVSVVRDNARQRWLGLFEQFAGCR
jgi:hypothetical protein